MERPASVRIRSARFEILCRCASVSVGDYCVLRRGSGSREHKPLGANVVALIICFVVVVFVEVTINNI